MPELPDVEIYKQYIDSTSLDQKIKKTETGDQKVMQVSPSQAGKELSGKKLTKTKRLGKWLFCSVENEKWLVMHFGMTGRLKYSKDQEPPDHAHFRIYFDNSFALYFISVRKLGKIDITEDIETFAEKNKLGKDALELSKDDFIDKIRSKQSQVKRALMNQESISGIGNIYSDEILFQARLHPKTKSSELSIDELENLYKKMRDTLQLAIEKQADPDKFPEHFIIPHRKKDGKCPVCEGQVKKITVSGRGCYICPACQKKS